MKTLKGAVIGYGFISAKGHVPAYLERNDVSIVAIADVSEGRRRIAVETIPGIRIYPDYKSLLEHEKDLDFVDISTPPCDHAEITLAALDQGLHVLCEKPLAVSTAEAQSMLTRAQERNRVLFPCHNYKHAPVVKALREIIESGKIGKVRSVYLTTFRNTHAKGVTEWNTHWRRHRKWSGGGIAMDHGSHSFYLTFEWLKSFPTSLTAKMATVNQQYDTEDNYSTVLTFPTGYAHLTLSWTAANRKVIYCIQGDRGAITIDNDDFQLERIEKTSGPDIAQGAVQWMMEKRSIASHWMDASHVSWFNSLFDQFRNAIESREYVGGEAKEAFECIRIIEASYQSAHNESREVILNSVSLRR